MPERSGAFKEMNPKPITIAIYRREQKAKEAAA